MHCVCTMPGAVYPFHNFLHTFKLLFAVFNNTKICDLKRHFKKLHIFLIKSILTNDLFCPKSSLPAQTKRAYTG